MSKLYGRIITNHGKAIALETADGQLLRASARRKLGLIVCGDYVEYELTGDEAVITGVEDRRSIFARPDRRRRIKPLASNVDQLVIVSAYKPGIDMYLVNSYLVTAENMGVNALLVFNKSDLEHDTGLTRSRIDYYTKLGYQAIETSPKTGAGMDELVARVNQQTNIFVGQSGVGKSSLIQYLLPDMEIQVGALSEATGLGSHTTTTTTLYHFPSGGDLIDSPGVREFATWCYEEEQIRSGFRDFTSHSDHCRFHNCRHLSEPGCAVKQAIEDGLINAERMQHYQRMLEEMTENTLLP